jgi:signal transduction histidine kinase
MCVKDSCKRINGDRLGCRVLEQQLKRNEKQLSRLPMTGLQELVLELNAYRIGLEYQMENLINENERLKNYIREITTEEAAPPDEVNEKEEGMDNATATESGWEVGNHTPVAIGDLGLCGAVRSLCRENGKGNGVRIHYSLLVNEIKIPETLKVIMFLIVREAVENAIKHSKGNIIEVILSDAGDRIEMLVEDNGEGFDGNKIRRRPYHVNSGIGLLAMEELANVSNGRLTVHADPGRGTVVSGEWPKPADVVTPL